MTSGVATSVYRCSSSPSKSQPNHAAAPDFHCRGEMPPRLSALAVTPCGCYFFEDFSSATAACAAASLATGTRKGLQET
jgi:hypothetical protein